MNSNEALTRQLAHELLDRMDIFHVIAFSQVMNELSRAEDLHPDWPTDQVHAAAIVGEEAGELLQAAIDTFYESADPAKAKEEAIHTAATAVRFIVNAPVESPNGSWYDDIPGPEPVRFQ